MTCGLFELARYIPGARMCVLLLFWKSVEFKSAETISVYSETIKKRPPSYDLVNHPPNLFPLPPGPSKPCLVARDSLGFGGRGGRSTQPGLAAQLFSPIPVPLVPALI